MLFNLPVNHNVCSSHTALSVLWLLLDNVLQEGHSACKNLSQHSANVSFRRPGITSSYCQKIILLNRNQE